MNTKIKILVFSLISVGMLVVGLIFAANYKKESIKYFYNSGYVINNVYDGDSNVNKIYFDAETPYEIKTDYYTFKNTDGEKVTVDDENFIHYSNGDISSLKDGVAIDLSKIDSKLISYYNVFKESILRKATVGYEANNLNSTVSFEKLMYKISNNKYLIASSNIIVSFSDDQTINMEDYIEIEYIDENVIRIYNDKVNYQTIASNLYVILDDIKIDLEYKTISKNGVKYLTMADMIINFEDNIEILPTPVIPPENENTGSNNENNNQGGSSDNSSQLINELNNINLPQIDNTKSDEPDYVQPKFVVETFEVTNLGFKNLKITVFDESSILYGDKIVEVIENSTGKIVQTFEPWEEGRQEYSINQFFALKPNSSYTLNVTGQYKIEETVYDRTFISKMFRTLDIGLDVEEDYVTDDSLSFIVYRNSYSPVSGFVYNITNSKGELIVEDKKVKYSDTESVILTEENQFYPNTEYTLNIKDIQYGNSVYSSVSYENLKLQYKVKTLKTIPSKEIELNATVNPIKNAMIFSLKNINDPNNGIVSYTYKVYNELGELVHTVTKDSYSDLEMNVEEDQKGQAFYFNVEIAFDDNEKTLIYTTENSELVSVGQQVYPQIIEYISTDEEKLDAETLDGILVLNDPDGFIQFNSIKKYKILIKEKAGSGLGAQQYEDQILIESESLNEEFLLPIKFKGLKPSTNYLLYVYLLLDDGASVYLGYENVKTKAPDPIYIKAENIEGDYNNNIFAYTVSISMETTSLDILNSITFELYGCSNNNVCAKLNKFRTIPRDQDSDELDALKDQGEVNVTSSQFGFFLESISDTYSYYKVVATGESSKYSIPVYINGQESNEFILKLLNLPPQLNILFKDILKQDCDSNTSCHDFYDNTSYNVDLYDDTIVGYDVEINNIRNAFGDVFDKLYYTIYAADGDCANSVPADITYSEKDFSNVVEHIFYPVGNFDDAVIRRGKKYCFAYNGQYGDEISNVQTISINPLKQSSKITGYIKAYDGNSLTFKLDIIDEDSSIRNIYLSEEKDLSVDGKNYTFSNIESGNSYNLYVDENIGNGVVSYKIYEANLDNIINYGTLNAIIDTSSNGKIIVKVPYGECEDEISCITNENLNKNVVAGIQIGNNYFDLIDDDENNYLYSIINLSEARDKGLSISNGLLTINNLKIVYDGGNQVDYLDSAFAFFVKAKNQIQNQYFNGDLNMYSKISTLSIFNTAAIKDRVRSFEFYHSGEIGKYLIEDDADSLKKVAHFNLMKSTSSNLYDNDGTLSTQFEVSEILSTSKINTVNKLNGAKVSFKITSSISNGTKLRIVLDGNSLAELTYNGNSFNSVNNENIAVSFDSSNNTVSAEFKNLNENDHRYSIEYSAYVNNTNLAYDVTYNDDLGELNENLVITTLKRMKIQKTAATYNKSYWDWNADSTDIYFEKNLTVEFSVDTSVYELENGNSILFDIAVRNLSDGSDTMIANNLALNSNLIDDVSSNKYVLNEALEQLNGVYNVVLIPKVSGNTSKQLENYVIDKELTFSRSNPKINVTNYDEPIFNIAVDDEDGVLVPCTSEQLSYDTNVIQNVANGANYFSVNNVKDKALYFELYDSNGFLGYSKIPFINKNSSLNLYDYFESKKLSSGIYSVKIKYCTSDGLAEKAFSQFRIIMDDNIFNVKLIKLPTSFVLMMEDPDVSIENVSRIEYQYTTTSGTNKVEYLNNINLNTDDDFEFTTIINKTTNVTTYFLGLTVDNATANISNLVVKFYSDNSIITTYSYNQ